LAESHNLRSKIEDLRLAEQKQSWGFISTKTWWNDGGGMLQLAYIPMVIDFSLL